MVGNGMNQLNEMPNRTTMTIKKKVSRCTRYRTATALDFNAFHVEENVIDSRQT